jgi:hypothetical protein
VKFRRAVEQTVSTRDAYRKGLQALRPADRTRISAEDDHRLAGGVDLDSACKHSHPSDARWDYGIGYQPARNHSDHIFWIEVHGARTNTHLAEVGRKLEWLKAWLAREGKTLQRFPACYVWIASGEVSFTQTSRQIRSLAERGLSFAGRRYVIR